jgi:AcrR family transcriptional regulator
VFANFTDKADLFNEVLVADHEALAQRVRQAAQSDDAVDAALLNLFTVAYEFHLEQLPLLRAGVSLSWTHGPAAEARSREGGREVLGLVEGALRRGIDSGSLAKGMDVALVADLIWQSYLANYRLAVFDGWGLGELRERLGRQIAIVLAGFRF